MDIMDRLTHALFLKKEISSRLEGLTVMSWCGNQDSKKEREKKSVPMVFVSQAIVQIKGQLCQSLNT